MTQGVPGLLKSLFIILFLRLLSWLPLDAGRGLGACLGRACWLVNARMVKTTRVNLRLCYPDMPESEQALLGRSSISNTFQTMAECGPVWLWPADKVLDAILEVEGLALLEAAMAQGKGAVVMAPHLGNWEVFGLYLNNCGFGQSSQLYQAPRDKRLDRLIYAARSRAGANMVATDAKGVAMLLKALKSGEIVGILPDQVPPESGGDYAPFFGTRVLTMSLVSRLLQKTGARAVLGVAVRTRKGGRQGWKVVFRQADDEIYAEHIPTSLAAMNRGVEAIANEYPAQYQWEYKRFKRVPAGQQRPY